MKIVIIGGTGLIGSRLVNKLHQFGHEAIAASRATGINTITGEGLDEALKDAQVVVDVSNSPSFEGQAAMDFFQTSTKNLLSAEANKEAMHHVLLSIVGADRPGSGPYFRAKSEQEKLVMKSGIPYTILRSTQFFEFAGTIAQLGTVHQEIHIPTGLVQPIAADEVVIALTNIIIQSPLNSTIEVAGPVRMRMDEFIGVFLELTKDSRRLVADNHALYFGAELDDDSLIPGDNPRIGGLKYDDWFISQHLTV